MQSEVFLYKELSKLNCSKKKRIKWENGQKTFHQRGYIDSTSVPEDMFNTISHLGQIKT
jgi:hypothetical protein